MKKQKVALLTGTINPKKFKTPFTKLLNEKKRLNEYLDTIRKYILKSNFDTIIFCENSDYQYDYSGIISFAKEKGKNLEIIKFLGSIKEIHQKGKGYGEGEIIEYAIKHSRFLKNKDQTFYKITGRIFIKNINFILKYSQKQNYFFTVGKNHCVTLFFKTSVKFYLSTFKGKYKKCNERKGDHLENVFYFAIKGKKEINNFSSYPKYIGSSGTKDEPYSRGIKWFIREIQLKFGFLDIK